MLSLHKKTQDEKQERNTEMQEPLHDSMQKEDLDDFIFKNEPVKLHSEK